jgi:hypothetical protein
LALGVASIKRKSISFSNLSFNHKEWGKTTTKTDEVAPEAGRVPVATRATGVPVSAAPSAPTNPFDFHCLTFLLITKSGEKQQRKPRQ